MANEFIARNGLISQNNSVVTGSLTVTQGITGSLRGTSSWASNAQAINISDNTSYGGSTFYPIFSVTSEGPATLNVDSQVFTYNPETNILTTTSSRAISSSYALTASYVENAQSASYVLQAVSSSFAATASFALNAGGGGTSLGTLQAFTLGLQNIF